MKYSKNRYAYPEPLYDCLSQDNYDPGKCNITITAMQDNARKRLLLKYESKNLELDVSENIRSLRGQLFHELLYGKAKKYTHLAEKRFYAKVDGWILGGKPDYPTMSNETLIDWKCCSIYSYLSSKEDIERGMESDWERQLNSYRWLLSQNNIEVNKLLIWAWTDIRPGEMERKPEWPSTEIVPLEVPLWTMDRARDYIEERVRYHKQAEEDYLRGSKLINCSDEDRWYTGDKYAVKKRERKTALRVLDTMEQAKQWTIDHELDGSVYIENRPGKYRRCHPDNFRNYCAAFEICDQANNVTARSDENEKLVS